MRVAAARAVVALPGGRYETCLPCARARRSDVLRPSAAGRSGAAVRVGARSADPARPTSTSARSPAWRSTRRATSSCSRAATRPGRPTWRPAAQLLEFDPKGKFVREIGKNLFALVLRARGPHRQAGQHLDRRQGLEHDPEDEPAGPRRLGVRPQGRVVAPRRAARLRVAADRHPRARRRARSRAPANNNPRNPVPVHRDNVFNQPTDVAWDSQGNSYFTDGYVNSRVGKANAKGEWVASWGSLGNGPGQFDTPHGIAVSPKDEIYVADRGNRRIQVFDTDGQVPPRVHHRRAGRHQARQDHLRRRRPERQDRIAGARRARRAVHDARAEPGAVRRRPLSEPHLQGVARGQAARRLRPAGPQPRRVRLDPRASRARRRTRSGSAS